MSRLRLMFNSGLDDLTDLADAAYLIGLELAPTASGALVQATRQVRSPTVATMSTVPPRAAT